MERLEPNRSDNVLNGGVAVKPFDGAQGRLIEQLERAPVFDGGNHVQVNVHETTSAKRRNKWQEGALVRPEVRAYALSGKVHNLLLRGSAGTRAPWLNVSNCDDVMVCRTKGPHH